MNRQIIVIDNDPACVELIKSHYENRGCQVHICRLLQEGIDWINQHNPEIAFLGYNQPEGNGWELAPVFEKAFPKMWSVLLYDEKGPAQYPLKDDESEFVMVWKPLETGDLDQVLDGYFYHEYIVYDAAIMNSPDAEVLGVFHRFEDAYEFMQKTPRKNVLHLTSNMWDNKTQGFVIVDQQMYGDTGSAKFN